MCMPQEMSRIRGVMAHQTNERGAVALPVMPAQFRRSGLLQAQVPLQVLRHRLVDVRKDVRGGVVQGVIEIEYPSPAERHRLEPPVEVTLIMIPLQRPSFSCRPGSKGERVVQGPAYGEASGGRSRIPNGGE